MFVPLSRVTCLCGKEIGYLTIYVIMHIEDYILKPLVFYSLQPSKDSTLGPS